MSYKSDSKVHRNLNDKEEAEFRKHARENPPNMANWDLYHPVCRDEWLRCGMFDRYYLTVRVERSLKEDLIAISEGNMNRDEYIRLFNETVLKEQLEAELKDLCDEGLAGVFTVVDFDLRDN